MKIKELINSQNIDLPDSLVDLIDITDGQKELFFNINSKYREFLYESFYIYGADELLKEVKVAGSGKELNYKCLRLFRKGEKNSFVFGKDNGDYFYIKLSDASVWIYYHDGAEKKKLSDSFDQFISETSETWYGREAYNKQVQSQMILGTWVPCDSRTVKKSQVQEQPTYTFNVNKNGSESSPLYGDTKFIFDLYKDPSNNKLLVLVDSLGDDDEDSYDQSFLIRNKPQQGFMEISHDGTDWIRYKKSS